MRLWRGVLFGVVMYALIGLVLMLAFGERPSWASEVRREYVDVTFYLPTGNPMRSGLYPFVGAAACDTSVFPMGTILEFADGFQVECLDTGYLRRGQVDVFSPTLAWGRSNVEAAYGRFAWTTVVRFGWGE